MKITTRLNPGDTFFALDGGKIKEHKVNFLSVTSSAVGQGDQPARVSYFPMERGEKSAFEEKEVFASKRLLLKAIQA